MVLTWHRRFVDIAFAALPARIPIGGDVYYVPTFPVVVLARRGFIGEVHFHLAFLITAAAVFILG